MAAPYDLPPPGGRWITTDQAGQLLAVRRQEVLYLIRQGNLPAQRHGCRWSPLVAAGRRSADVDAGIEDRARWFFHAEAARITGCAYLSVATLVRAGEQQVGSGRPRPRR